MSWEGCIIYSGARWRNFARAHKRIKGMRRKPKIGFLIPSINNYYGQKALYSPKQKRAFTQKFILPESLVYLDFIKEEIKKEVKHLHLKGTALELVIKRYYPDNRIVDVDNPKAVMDALKGLLYEDDSQVHRLVNEKFMNSGKEKVIIKWRKINQKRIKSSPLHKE